MLRADEHRALSGLPWAHAQDAGSWKYGIIQFHFCKGFHLLRSGRISAGIDFYFIKRIALNVRRGSSTAVSAAALAYGSVNA